MADLLEVARLEAEELAAPAADDHQKPVGPATDVVDRMDADIAKDKAKRKR